MLKITYTDSGLWLECLPQTVEAVVAQRSILATRLGQPLVVESTYAAFPLWADLPGMDQFIRQASTGGDVAVDGCDRNLLEVTLRGTWVADSPTSDEGIFLAELEASVEQVLWQLWQQSQKRAQANARRRVPKAC